jgi:hypothetical protein
MRKFIFCFLLLLTTLAVSIPAHAQSVSDASVPSWLEPYKRQLWTPQGLLTLLALAASGYLIMSGEGKSKKSLMASARWAGSREKLVARKVAIKQINLCLSRYIALPLWQIYDPIRSGGQADDHLWDGSKSS